MWYLLSPSSPVPCVADAYTPCGGFTYNLVRQDSRDPDWESKGLKYATINYDEPSTLVDAFRGAEVVISTVSYRAVDQQRQLARAAKEAEVKIFAPSEYGGEPIGSRTIQSFWQRSGFTSTWKKLNFRTPSSILAYFQTCSSARTLVCRPAGLNYIF